GAPEVMRGPRLDAFALTEPPHPMLSARSGSTFKQQAISWLELLTEKLGHQQPVRVTVFRVGRRDMQDQTVFRVLQVRPSCFLQFAYPQPAYEQAAKEGSVRAVTAPEPPDFIIR